MTLGSMSRASCTSLGIGRGPGTNVSFVGLLPMECGHPSGTRETLQTVSPLCQRGRTSAPTSSQPQRPELPRTVKAWRRLTCRRHPVGIIRDPGPVRSTDQPGSPEFAGRTEDAGLFAPAV